MDDYSIDYGKLAYLKTEDLSKRLLAVEDKKQLSYNSLHFKEENFAEVGAKNEFFRAETQTDLNVSYRIKGAGAVSLSVYLNDVFMYAEDLILSGEKTLEFEARGVSPGEKVLRTVLDGSVTDVSITVSGYNLSYMDYYTNLSCDRSLAEQLIFASIDGKPTLYKYNGGLVKVRDNFAAAKNCCVVRAGEGFAALLYTVWDDCLWLELTTAADGYSTVQKTAVSRAVSGFTACFFQNELRVYVIKGGRVYLTRGIFEQGRIYFSSEKQVNMPASAELQSAKADDRLYIVSSDAAGSSKLYTTLKNTSAEDGIFSFSAAAQLLRG